MTVPTNEKPHGGDRGAGITCKSSPAYVDSLTASYGAKPAKRIPHNWRERLPDPGSYYRQYVSKLGMPNCNGYAVGLCPFHDDHNPSFGVKLNSGRGRWCCYSGCGEGDMVEFHQRLTGLGFVAAVRDLLATCRAERDGTRGRA